MKIYYHKNSPLIASFVLLFVVLSSVSPIPLAYSDQPSDFGNNMGDNQPGITPGENNPQSGSQPGGDSGTKDPDSPLFPPTEHDQPKNPGNPNEEIKFNTTTPWTSFYAYDEPFRGGVRVASGDVDRDGTDEVITGAGPGAGPHVKVFGIREDGSQYEKRSFYAFDYDPQTGVGFTGGVFVGSGDVNGDGYADIIVGAGAGGNSHIKVFSGLDNSEIYSFYAFQNSDGTPAFQGAVRVAGGDINGDGYADIIVGAGPGADSHVKVFDGRTGAELQSFDAFEPGFTGGVYVTAGDMNGDGIADVVVARDAMQGTGPDVKIFDGRTNQEIGSFQAYEPTSGGTFAGGVRLAAKDGIILFGDGPGPNTDANMRAFDIRPGINGKVEVASFHPFEGTFFGGIFVSVGRFFGKLGLVVGAGGGSYDSPYGPQNSAGPHVKIFYSDDTVIPIPPTPGPGPSAVPSPGPSATPPIPPSPGPGPSATVPPVDPGGNGGLNPGAAPSIPAPGGGNNPPAAPAPSVNPGGGKNLPQPPQVAPSPERARFKGAADIPNAGSDTETERKRKKRLGLL